MDAVEAALRASPRPDHRHRIEHMGGTLDLPRLERAKRLLMLIDRKNGRGMGMTFFDTEEDMRRGDEALNAMNPEGSARRTAVEMYEVGLDEQF